MTKNSSRSRSLCEAATRKAPIADIEHRFLQSADAKLIIHATPAQYAEGIEITVPSSAREEQAVKPFFTVASLENAKHVAVESGDLTCGPVWSGPSMRVCKIHDRESSIIRLRQSAA